MIILKVDEQFYQQYDLINQAKKRAKNSYCSSINFDDIDNNEFIEKDNNQYFFAEDIYVKFYLISSDNNSQDDIDFLEEINTYLIIGKDIFSMFKKFSVGLYILDFSWENSDGTGTEYLIIDDIREIKL